MKTYYCGACKATFEGIDPISFADCGVAEPVLPTCPKAKKDPKFFMTVSQFEAMTVEELQTYALYYRDVRNAHPVSQHVPKPLQGAWAKPGSNLLKQETDEERGAREEKDRLKREEERLRKALADAKQKGQELINKIDQWIDTNDSKVAAARPNDDIYPGEDARVLKATAAVIHQATVLWNARRAAAPAANYHVLVGPKDDWRMGRTEADFMRNNGRGGKHIAHVIVKD